MTASKILISILCSLSSIGWADLGVRLGAGLQSSTRLSDEMIGGEFTQSSSSNGYQLSMVATNPGAPAKLLISGFFGQYAASGQKTVDKSIFFGGGSSGHFGAL